MVKRAILIEVSMGNKESTETIVLDCLALIQPSGTLPTAGAELKVQSNLSPCSIPVSWRKEWKTWHPEGRSSIWGISIGKVVPRKKGPGQNLVQKELRQVWEKPPKSQVTWPMDAEARELTLASGSDHSLKSGSKAWMDLIREEKSKSWSSSPEFHHPQSDSEKRFHQARWK